MIRLNRLFKKYYVFFFFPFLSQPSFGALGELRTNPDFIAQLEEAKSKKHSVIRFQDADKTRKFSLEYVPFPKALKEDDDQHIINIGGHPFKVKEIIPVPTEKPFARPTRAHKWIEEFEKNPIPVCNELIKRKNLQGVNFHFPELAPVVNRMLSYLNQGIFSDFKLTPDQDYRRKKLIEELKGASLFFPAGKLVYLSYKYIDLIDYLHHENFVLPVLQERLNPKTTIENVMFNFALTSPQWNFRVQHDGAEEPSLQRKDFMGYDLSNLPKILENPNVILIPTFEDLDLDFFNYTLPSKCQIVGMTERITTYADTILMSPLIFLNHDLDHTDLTLNSGKLAESYEEQLRLKSLFMPHYLYLAERDADVYQLVRHLIFLRTHENPLPYQDLFYKRSTAEWYSDLINDVIPRIRNGTLEDPTTDTVMNSIPQALAWLSRLKKLKPEDRTQQKEFYDSIFIDDFKKLENLALEIGQNWDAIITYIEVPLKSIADLADPLVLALIMKDHPLLPEAISKLKSRELLDELNQDRPPYSYDFVKDAYFFKNRKQVWTFAQNLTENPRQFAALKNELSQYQNHFYIKWVLNNPLRMVQFGAQKLGADHLIRNYGIYRTQKANSPGRTLGLE